MYSSYSGYGFRFLNHEDFLSLCSKLEIKLLSSSVNSDWLQYLHKKAILFPEIRLIKPIWYLDFKFREEISNEVKINSSRYIITKQYYERVESWRRSNKLFHPFDHNALPCEQLEKPSKSKYCKWKDYYRKIAKEGSYYSLKRDVYYYHYWRAYQLYEITKACTYKYIYNAFEEIDVKSYKKNFKYHLLKANRWQVASSTPASLKQRIFENDANFNHLSQFILLLDRYDNYCQFINRNEKNKSLSWEEECKLSDRRENYIANKVVKIYSLVKDDLLYFLKNLCQKYFEYENDGKQKLAQMIRDDIYYLRKLILLGYGISKEEIESEIRKTRMRYCFHKNPLKYIFEGEFAEAREDVHRIFENSVKQFSLINEKEAIYEEIERFLNFMDENGMENIYLIVKKSFHSPKDYRTPHNLIDKLTSLSVYFESYLKALIIKRTSLATTDWFNSNKRSIQSMLNLLFKQESWISSLNEALNVEKYKHVTKENINILEKEIQTLELNKNKEANEIVKMFLLINVLRNSVAHDYFKVNNTLENGHVFLNIIVAAMWYCWFRTKNMPYN